MTSTAKKVLEDALALPVDERRTLAEQLIKSVPRESAGAVSEAWDAEVLERLEAAERGEVQTRDWDVACRELRSKHLRA